MFFVSRQDVEKYLREKTGVKVSVSRTEKYFYLHYVDKMGEIGRYRIEAYTLAQLSEQSFTKFVELCRE